MADNEKNWEYETKCRRCGALTDWFFSTVDKMEWLDFMKAMVDYIRFPRNHHCRKCKKNTVQDVVSYTEHPGI